MVPIDVRFHPAAVDEVSAAVSWYQQRNPQAGIAFREAFGQAIGRIESYPDSWPAYMYGTRRLLMRLFPFHVIYRVRRNSVEIIAVAHERRRPGYWASRSASR